MLYIVAGIVALGSFLIPRAIDMFQLQADGIRHLAQDVERYHNNTRSMEGDYTVTIDLSNPESNEGKVLFDGEEGDQIYISRIVQSSSSYIVVFRSSGSYNLGGGTLVSGLEHARNKNGFTHEFKAKAQASYNGETYKLKPSSSSGLNYRSGDEFGFYLFSPDEEIDITKEQTIEVTITNLQLNIWAEKVNH
ncbi:hypothetical protein ACGTN9_00740 [Halobacillus sp. MO56]